MDRREHKAKLMKDPAFRAAREALEPEYQLRRQLVQARLLRGMTQNDLASRLGTGQAAISRWERGAGNITFQKLVALAEALDCELQLRIELKRDVPFMAEGVEVQQLRLGASSQP
jgi:transcriptional regulator with XRE-family HTH domain